MAVQYAFAKVITTGLAVSVDAADTNSYPGSGTSWINVVNPTITGSIVSGSYSSDFKGGIVLGNVSSSIIFTGSVGNYNSSSFTVEMSIRPSRIEGIHWLFSKNSGSFPNWGAYISGSGGRGKAFLVCNLSSTISASFTSSDFLTTGSTYVSSFRFSPFVVSTYGTPVAGASMTFNNGLTAGGLLQANGSGSLGSTSSLFVGNTNTQNLAFSGSIYNFKVYQGPASFSQTGINYSAQCTRFGLQQQSPATRFIRTLAVGSGGPGGWNPYMGTNLGGGGGGGVVEAYTTINTGRNSVIVSPTTVGGYYAVSGPGASSSFSDIVAYGGGYGGGSYTEGTNSNGASGGGRTTAPFGVALLISGSYQGFNSSADGVTTGGGGAGGPAVGNIGGPGKASDITGVVTYYGGGGAGTTTQVIPPSLGGGGGSSGYRQTLGLPGGDIAGMSGSANTGGGGSAGVGDARGWESVYSYGGSGIVIMRYQGAQQAIGGQITRVGTDTVHTYTASGDFILL